MKITCNREKMLHAFQTVPPSPRPAARSRSCRTSSSKWRRTKPRSWPPTWKSASATKSPGVEVEAPGAAVLPVARFGSILRESSDATFRIESGRRRHHDPRRAQPVQAARRKPARVSRRRRVRRIELPRISGPAVPRADPPHDLRHRQRKQPLRPRRREARVERQRAHRRRHRWPPPGQDGRPGPSRRRAGAIRRRDRRPHAGDELLERALGRRRQRSPNRRPRKTTSSSRTRGRRFTRGCSKAASRAGATCFPQRANVGEDRPDRRPVPLGRPPGGDRHQRRKPRRRLHVRRRQLVLAGQTAEVGQSRVELPIAYDGQPISITLDPRFVSDFLKVLEPEKTFTIDLQDSDAAAVCTTDDGYGYVIMPLARDR